MTAIEPSLDRDSARQANRLPGVAETAMLTHDIRTSLNGILGGLCTIDFATLPEEARQQIERVHAASLVLASLISQAIGEPSDLTGAEVLGASTDLVEFQDFLMRRWQGAATSRGLEFVVSAERGLPSSIEARVVDLSRMVGNLVCNSIRHTEAGRIEVNIARARQGGLDIVVRDTGPGIDEAVLRAVARPGFGDALQIDARKSLGLQIVKSLTSEMGGRFSLRNAPEGGSVAAIWLPARLLISGPSANRSSAVGKISFPALEGRRILLAEDNPTNQMVATQMLAALKADVAVASDGVEALEAFSQERFDLVVVDIEMPRLSGIDVIRAIRDLPDARSRTPIVALTAYALHEHKERIAKAGANGLISKPITGIEDFGRALSVHLEPAGARPAGPGQSQSEEQGECIDRDVYDALVVAVGQDMRNELLERVVADLAGARAELEAALETLDLEAIRSASHILISVGGAVGANRVFATAREVNAGAHGRDHEGLPGKTRKCIAELDNAIAFIESERLVTETA